MKAGSRPYATIRATLRKADGTVVELGVLSDSRRPWFNHLPQWIKNALNRVMYSKKEAQSGNRRNDSG